METQKKHKKCQRCEAEMNARWVTETVPGSIEGKYRAAYPLETTQGKCSTPSPGPGRPPNPVRTSLHRRCRLVANLPSLHHLRGAGRVASHEPDQGLQARRRPTQKIERMVLTLVEEPRLRLFRQPHRFPLWRPSWQESGGREDLAAAAAVVCARHLAPWTAPALRPIGPSRAYYSKAPATS